MKRHIIFRSPYLDYFIWKTLIGLEIMQVMFSCRRVGESREKRELDRERNIAESKTIPRRYLSSNFIIEVAGFSSVALLNLFGTFDTTVFLISPRIISRSHLYFLRSSN